MHLNFFSFISKLQQQLKKLCKKIQQQYFVYKRQVIYYKLNAYKKINKDYLNVYKQDEMKIIILINSRDHNKGVQGGQRPEPHFVRVQEGTAVRQRLLHGLQRLQRPHRRQQQQEDGPRVQVGRGQQVQLPGQDQDHRGRL